MGAIFAPDQHDRLLFDDDAFSRSRLYFWAIDSLELFIPSIAANIQEWENFWTARKIYFQLTSENDVMQNDPRRDNKKSYESIVRQVEDEVVRLRALKVKLELLREQIKTLRDGVSCQCEPYDCTMFDRVRSYVALQCQCSHRIPGCHRAWSECEAIDICQYRLPTAKLLCRGLERGL